MTREELKNFISECVSEELIKNNTLNEKVDEDFLDEAYLEQCELLENTLYNAYTESIDKDFLTESYCSLLETNRLYKHFGGDSNKINLARELQRVIDEKNSTKKNIIQSAKMSNLSKDKIMRLGLSSLKRDDPDSFNSLSDEDIKNMTSVVNQMDGEVKSDFLSDKVKFDKLVKRENELRKQLNAGVNPDKIGDMKNYTLSDNYTKSADEIAATLKKAPEKEAMTNTVVKKISPTASKAEVHKAAATTVANKANGFSATNDGKVVPNATLLAKVEKNPISKKKILAVAGILTAISASVAAAAIIRKKKKAKEEEKKKK